MIGRMLLSNLETTKKSVLLLGPRQVGKSTLISELKPDLTIHLADETVFQSHLKDTSLLKRELNALKDQKGPLRIAIDEAQRIPSLLNTVQALIDGDRRLQFFLTGSSARKLRRGQANLLPGRIILRSLHPVTFWEQAPAVIEECLRLGCLPEIVTLSRKPDQAADLLRSYSEIYLREEIQAEALTRDLGGYARFLDVAAELSGQYLNYAKVASDTEINKETIRRYFQILEDTLLIHRLEPFTATRSTRRVRQTDRFVFFDMGVRNSILRKLKSQFTPTELGPIFEQWVILQVIAYNAYKQNDWHISSFRDELGNEVDLIIETDRELIAIEIKFQKKFRPEFGRGLHEFKRLLKSPKKLSTYVVYCGDTKQKTDRGDLVVPYGLFLNEMIPRL